MTTVAATLAERGSRYGAFADHARIAQGIQDVMRAHPNWDRLDLDMKQALTVIADKIARILNGDPFYLDNWHDIQGYAQLIEDRLKMVETQPAPTLYEPPQPSYHPGPGSVLLTQPADGYTYNARGEVIGGAGGGGYYDN